MGENFDCVAAAQLHENKQVFQYYNMLRSSPQGKLSHAWCYFKAQCLGNMVTDTENRLYRHAANTCTVPQPTHFVSSTSLAPCNVWAGSTATKMQSCHD